jgi:hypothetical protein
MKSEGLMSLPRKFLPVLLVIAFALAAPAQQPTTSSGATVEVVEVKASATEAEVGQQVKLTVVARDKAGNVVNQQPSTYFAGPFDIAAADDNGTISLFGPGEVTAGALVGGKPGFTKITVRPATVNTVSIEPVSKPLTVGGTVQLNATARTASGDPRTDASISWTSRNPAVAPIDAAGVVTGIAPGETIVSAASGAANSTIAIHVVKSNLRGLSIEPRTANARTGDVVHFNATGVGSSDFTIDNCAGAMKGEVPSSLRSEVCSDGVGTKVIVTYATMGN